MFYEVQEKNTVLRVTEVEIAVVALKRESLLELIIH